MIDKYPRWSRQPTSPVLHLLRCTLACLIPLTLLLSGCEQTSHLARIQQSGKLIVATQNSPTSYYEGANGAAGLEYELVSRFAEMLGVEVEFRFPGNLGSLLDATRHSQVHMAAAGLTATETRIQSLDFSSAYQGVTEQLIYRQGSKRPKSLSDIRPQEITVVANTSHDERLRAYQRTQYPDLQWSQVSNIGTPELLQKVNQAEIKYTVVDSNGFALNQRLYPYLRRAFDLSDPQQLGWAFPKTTDKSVLAAANTFLDGIRNDGTLKRLIERYYGHTGRMNLVDKRAFWRHVDERLPPLLAHFKETAKLIGLDWRLLAAVGYQESHWRADAVSPTGVRGIMMLTRATAKQVGVKDRKDPQQSIHGGAKYLQIVDKKIPKRINKPDRIWLALAGYNVGFGHLEDARILTQRQGDNPDLWLDVKKRLPLLSQKKYYSTVKYGRARGGDAFTYVENIRNYYDLLVWRSNKSKTGQPDKLSASMAKK